MAENRLLPLFSPTERDHSDSNSSVGSEDEIIENITRMLDHTIEMADSIEQMQKIAMKMMNKTQQKLVFHHVQILMQQKFLISQQHLLALTINLPKICLQNVVLGLFKRN